MTDTTTTPTETTASPATAAAPAAAPAQETAAAPAAEAPKADAAAPQPVALDKFYEAYSANGKLSDDEYKGLADLGFSKEMVDTYISGHSAVMTQADQDAILAGVGGKESFDQIAKWAGQTLSDDELAEFNGLLADKKAAPFALKTLKARMEAAEGKAPTTTVEGAAPKAQTATGFKSVTEMKTAMKDPRYSGLRRDAEYVKWVEKQTALAKF